MTEDSKPKHLKVLKVLGIFFACVGVSGIVLSIVFMGDFSTNLFMIGGFMACFGLFAGAVCLISGFRPEMTKMGTKTTKYIQEQNKEDLSDIASTTAEIASNAITNVTKSIKKGLEDETMFCKHCGQEIDSDSTFCKKCGKEQ